MSDGFVTPVKVKTSMGLISFPAVNYLATGTPYVADMTPNIIRNNGLSFRIVSADITPFTMNDGSGVVPLWNIEVGNERKILTLSNGNEIWVKRDGNIDWKIKLVSSHFSDPVLVQGWTEWGRYYQSLVLITSGNDYTLAFAWIWSEQSTGRGGSVGADYLGLDGPDKEYAKHHFFDNSLIFSDDPYATNDNQTPSGGYGEFNFTGDDDLPPALPSASASQVGFVSLWNPTQQEMKDLASYMWSNSIFDVSTWKKLFADPMECILSVGIIPVNPSISAAKENIQIGNISTNVQAYRITNQFVSVDFGKINLKGQSASYMDYAPYCRASIYLPYCGDFALNVDDIMDAEMSLEYHIDIYTGACVAYLSIRRTNSDGSELNSTLYQFTGNVLSSIPITASDHSAFIQSLLFMGAGIAATVATGGAGAPAIAGASAAGDVAIGGAAAGLTAGNAINTVMSMKPDVQRSGNLSSTAGFLGKQKPCLTIHWSNLCRPSDEYKLLGMPLHKSGTLSDFSGFTIVSAVHMDDIPCTADELKLIEEALYKGVII